MDAGQASGWAVAVGLDEGVPDAVGAAEAVGDDVGVVGFAVVGGAVVGDDLEGVPLGEPVGVPGASGSWAQPTTATATTSVNVLANRAERTGRQVMPSMVSRTGGEACWESAGSLKPWKQSSMRWGGSWCRRRCAMRSG